MTRARSRRTARRKIKRLIRKTLKIVCAVWDFIARHPAMLAMPLIIFLLVLTIQMHEFEKQVQAWDQEIRQQQEQIEELYDRQDPVEQTDMTDVYGCKSLYGTYDFPWNTMSQDWGSDQVTGFYYHEISEECKAAGGELPTIIQVYTYIVCEQNGVDYEMVFALIEQESRCRWDAEGDNGTPIGLMQVSEKWHMQRMEELGAYDLKNPYQNVLVGVNLLREGLDIPEVSLVAIMDADKEGFLRSETSLIQTIGRAARNACGRVIMYADKITDSMEIAINETNRRREIQMNYNKEHGIVPKTIKKPVENNLLQLVASYRNFEDIVAEEMVEMNAGVSDIPKIIEKLEKDMHKAAKILDFERAAEIRDQLKKLREMAKNIKK